MCFLYLYVLTCVVTCFRYLCLHDCDVRMCTQHIVLGVQHLVLIPCTPDWLVQIEKQQGFATSGAKYDRISLSGHPESALRKKSKELEKANCRLDVLIKESFKYLNQRGSGIKSRDMYHLVGGHTSLAGTAEAKKLDSIITTKYPQLGVLLRTNELTVRGLEFDGWDFFWHNHPAAEQDLTEILTHRCALPLLLLCTLCVVFCVCSLSVYVLCR